MNQNPPQQNSPEPAATDASGRICWQLTIVAEPEPLLLSRVLQKLAVPEIELVTVHYAASQSGLARAELGIRARPERAHLAAVRLRKLVAISQVSLEPKDNLRRFE